MLTNIPGILSRPLKIVKNSFMATESYNLFLCKKVAYKSWICNIYSLFISVITVMLFYIGGEKDCHVLPTW